jgi:hypothetical protein
MGSGDVENWAETPAHGGEGARVCVWVRVAAEKTAVRRREEIVRYIGKRKAQFHEVVGIEMYVLRQILQVSVACVGLTIRQGS